MEDDGTSAAPFQFTRSRQNTLRMNTSEPACARPDGTYALPPIIEGPYALRVRVETVDEDAIPPHLWSAAIADEVFQAQGLPPAGEVVIVAQGDLYWFGHDRRRGLSLQEAEDLSDLVAGTDCWFRRDLRVMANSAPVTLQVAERAARDATPRRRVSAPDLGQGEARGAQRRRNRKQERRERRQRRRERHPSPNPSGSSHGGPPSGHGSDPPSDDDYGSSYGGSSYGSTASGSSRGYRGARRFQPREHIERVPRIEGFQGDNTDRSDRPYEQWRFDVRMLQAGPYDQRTLRYEVIRSLTGVPGNRVRSLGEGTTIDEMLASLDELYGTTMTYGALLARLCQVRQGPKEPTVEYDSRLARAFAVMRQEFPERYAEENIEAKKRDLFYEGLRPEIQNAIEYLTDQQPPADYSRLLKAARKKEDRTKEAQRNRGAEAAPTNPTPKSTFRKPWTNTPQARQGTVVAEEPTGEDYASDEFDQETREEAAKIALNASMTAKRNFYGARKAGDTAQRKSGCWNCGEEGHFQRECPKPKNVTEGGQKGGNPPRTTTNKKQ